MLLYDRYNNYSNSKFLFLSLLINKLIDTLSISLIIMQYN